MMFARNEKKYQGLALLLMSILLATSGFAADWPQWRGPQGDGISKETGLLKTWPKEGPKVLWQAPLGQGFSCVAVADGRVFTICQQADGTWAFAFDEKTGKHLWKIRIGDPFPGGGFPGTRSTPIVDGPTVYLQDPQGDLSCVEATTGKEIWKRNILKDAQAGNLHWGIAMSPLVSGDSLYVTTGTSPKNGTITAYNKKNGEILWTSLKDNAAYASLTEATLGGQRQLIDFNESGIVGVSPKDGKELWRYNWKTKKQIYGVNPIVQGDLVYVSSDYGVGCLVVKVDVKDTTTSVKEVYQSKAMKNHFSTPVLIDGYLYGFDSGEFACIKLDTGEKKWSVPALGKGAFTVADGLAYILSEKGLLILAKLTPEKMEKITEVDGLVGPRCWTMPVVANGNLFIRDESKLLCLDVKAH